MSIQHTDADNVALFDSVTGIAFGPVFSDDAEASAFEHWATDKVLPLGVGRPVDLRELNTGELRDLADKWQRLLMDHSEAECPYDDHSYGMPGVTGDSDQSFGDYTAATLTYCTCECHTRGRSKR